MDSATLVGMEASAQGLMLNPSYISHLKARRGVFVMRVLRRGGRGGGVQDSGLRGIGEAQGYHEDVRVWDIGLISTARAWRGS